MSEDEARLGPDGNAWFSPGPCPNCLVKFKKEVWLTKLTVGNPSYDVSLDCSVCGYNVPLTYDGFKRLEEALR